MLEVYAMKLHLLDELVEDDRKSGDISVVNAFSYEQSNFDIKRIYREFSRRCATCIQKLLMLIDRQRRRERHAICAEVGNVSHNAIHWRSFKSMDEGGWLVQLI